MPKGVAAPLRTVRGITLQKVSETVECQITAKCIFKNLANAGAAEFISSFYIVTAGFPGVVIDHMPVRIHTIPRNAVSGTDLREPSHRNSRQATFISARSGVQTDRRRIESAVFREKALHVTVPAQPCFVNLAGVDDLHIRQRDQLNPRRRYRVETRQESAGKLCEGKTLIAVAEEITSSQ